MLFLAFGLLLIVLKILGLWPAATWDWETHWWVFGAPFAATIVWWQASDYFGLTKRKVMEKNKKRLALHRAKILEGLTESQRKKP